VELFVELGQQAARPSEWKGWLADRLHHRRSLEPVHDEVAVAGVVDVGAWIALGSDVLHDLGLRDQRPPIACDAQHAARPVLEDLTVSTLGELRSDRLHGDPSFLAATTVSNRIARTVVASHVSAGRERSRRDVVVTTGRSG
jgi:hypothetical protein